MSGTPSAALYVSISMFSSWLESEWVERLCVLNDVQYSMYLCACVLMYVQVYVEGIIDFIDIARAKKQLFGCTWQVAIIL